MRNAGDEHVYACYRTREELDTAEIEMARKEQPSAAEREEHAEVVLDIQHVSKTFPIIKGVLQRRIGTVHAVNNVSFTLHRGETLGIVGESGCGKTTLARTIIQAYRADSGTVIFEGKDLTKASEQELRSCRSHISMIFQDPFSSLDPRQSIGAIVGEPLLIHGMVSDREMYDARVEELFRLVGLDPGMRDRMPHEFSGGQRQRLGIARALASNPSVIICDEPISALDVSIQAQIINLLEELQQRLGIAYLFVTHDLAVAKHISDRIMVMYLGTVVEYSDSEALYDHPLHPYTQALLSAVPIADPEIESTRERIRLNGSVPSTMNRPGGCPFSDRCPKATEQCRREQPELKDYGGSHMAACFQVC
jgi:peptide/nickel transport system ATP-binding protein